jgi:hypothetical protein
MSNTTNLWDVHEIRAGLALELRGGNDPALVRRSTASDRVTQGGNRVRA